MVSIGYAPPSFFFYSAVARVAVNHELGTGTAPDPVVWSVGAPAKKPRLQEAVCEYAAPPGPDSLGCWGWVRMSGFSLTQADSDAWPYLVGLLVKFATSLGSLHWLVGDADLVMGEKCPSLSF